MHLLVLQCFHERFAGRVVPRIALARHADGDAVFLQQIRVIAAGILRTTVGLVNQVRTQHTALINVQDHSRENKLLPQPNIGNIRPPPLVYAGHHHSCRQVRVDFPAMIGIGGHDELALPDTEDIVFAHHPVNPLWVHRPALPPQIRRDSPPSVARPSQGGALDGIPQVRVGTWTAFRVLVEAIEAGTAYLRQLHHPLHYQSTAGIYFFLDLRASAGATDAARSDSPPIPTPPRQSVSLVPAAGQRTA